MKTLLLTILLLSLSSCSYLTDFLLKQDKGISVDAQIGDTDNKVKTGIGSIGNETTTTTNIEESQNVEVQNATGKFHLQADGETTVNVYETNPWLYLLFGLLAFGKPAINWFRNRKKINAHEQVTYTSTRRVASTYRDKPS
jgi:hypothetical protein